MNNVSETLTAELAEVFALLGTTFGEATAEQHAFAASVHMGMARVATMEAEEVDKHSQPL